MLTGDIYTHVKKEISVALLIVVHWLGLTSRAAPRNQSEGIVSVNWPAN